MKPLEGTGFVALFRILLRGSLTLVHVEKGTAYTIPATALSGFSDIVQHTGSGAALPNLSSAHDAGTETETGTQSTSCFEGKCVSDYWRGLKDGTRGQSPLERALTPADPGSYRLQ